MRFATTSLLVLLATLSVRAEHADVLRPNSLESVGHFCLTGLVTSISDNQNFVVAKADGRRQYLFTEMPLGLSTGDVVAIDGEFLLHDNGDVNPDVREARRIGRRGLPPPIEISLPELVKTNLTYHSVVTEGTLVLARRDEIDASTMQLIVEDDRSVLNASLSAHVARGRDFTDLLGARLRLTGVLMQSSGARKIMPPYLDIHALDIRKEVSADIFDAPALDFKIRSPGETLRLGLRRFEGVVLASWGGNRFMAVDKSLHRIKASLSLPQELPSAGAHVIVVGYPDSDLYCLNLEFARCRTDNRDCGAADTTPPLATTLKSLLTDGRGNPRLNGYSHGRLLRLSGTVLDIQPSLRMFSLNESGFTLPVDFSSSPSVLEKLEAKATVEAVVLAVVESDSWRENIVLPRTHDIRLVLRSPDDLRILARPPFWTPFRLFIIIVTLSVSLMLLVLGGRLVNRLVLRRKVAERTRLAVELHDALSQTLAGVSCQIAAGRDAVADDPQTATALLSAAERMLESSRTELKNCLFDLRNNTVDDPDIAHAIERTLAIFRDETDIAIRFPVSRALLSDTSAHAILSIIRELVANAIRHGKAARIRVAGAADEKQVSFSVTDNGTGFDPANHPGPREGHFGLTGIRERLAQLNGTIKIESSPHLTRISTTLPL